ncbi:MAG TPA: YggS family pyridoxal phosphate-dependent enzyme [Terriglobales bacterium]|nr:YggS family pyridoxal phosphate-dependent enzyme [Terriglobales bacterium]
MSIPSNIASLHDRIAHAARRAGRDPASVSLMAVTKTVEPARILQAYDAGLRLFGENRVQEFAHKAAELPSLPGAEWRLIGHLQTNKAAKAAELFQGVDSLDSIRLAEKLDAAARKLGRRIPVLLEVNLGGEASKSGLPPDSPQLEALLLAAPRLDALDFRGLMAIPPFTDDPEGARPYFRRLRELRDTIAERRLPAISMNELSIGMSHDFEVAIEEGSTCVRIGTAIFGPRPIGPGNR